MTEPRTDRLNELLDDYANSLEVNQAGFFAHPDSERRAARKALVDAFSEGISERDADRETIKNRDVMLEALRQRLLKSTDYAEALLRRVSDWHTAIQKEFYITARGLKEPVVDLKQPGVDPIDRMYVEMTGVLLDAPAKTARPEIGTPRWTTEQVAAVRAEGERLAVELGVETSPAVGIVCDRYERADPMNSDVCKCGAAQSAHPVPSQVPKQDGAVASAPDPSYARLPVKPTEAMLRPFMHCPTDELELAWQAMLVIATSTARRESAQGLVSTTAAIDNTAKVKP